MAKRKRQRVYHRVCVDMSVEGYQQLLWLAKVEGKTKGCVGRELLEEAVGRVVVEYDRPETEDEKTARFHREAIEFLGRPLEDGECARCYVAHCPEHQS